MKKVFSSSSDIAHLFANKLQEEARTSNNSFFFRNNTIYSYGYHFPIAKHIEFKGVQALLFTLRKYSNTTAKHINYVSQATNHLNKIYCAHPEAPHEDNFKFWLEQCQEICNKLAKAKKPEIYLNQLSGVNDLVVKYASFFDIDVPISLAAILATSNKEEYATYLANRRELEAAENKRKEAQLKAKHKEELAKWNNFELSRLYSRIDVDYLRLNVDTIETTQGVKIDLVTGKRFYESILNNTLLVGQHVLGFEVLSVDSKHIKVGCHNFDVKYLKQFGSKIFTSVPQDTQSTK
jgi:hypothetical protein